MYFGSFADVPYKELIQTTSKLEKKRKQDDPDLVFLPLPFSQIQTRF